MIILVYSSSNLHSDLLWFDSSTHYIIVLWVLLIVKVDMNQRHINKRDVKCVSYQNEVRSEDLLLNGCIIDIRVITF